MERPEPELYLSLLSSRYGSVSRLSAERRGNDAGSRICDDELFPTRSCKDPDRLLDVLDALAAICVRKDQGDIFFVSLAMDSKGATLYVSTNGPVPATLTTHLHKIRGKLKDLRSVLEFAASPPPDNDSPDPNSTPSWSQSELDIQLIIYEYSYKKVRRRYQKRGHKILEQYGANVSDIGTVVPADVKLLSLTQVALKFIDAFLSEERIQETHLKGLIKTIDGLSALWKGHLESAEEDSEDLLTRWDNLTGKFSLSSLIYDTIVHLFF
jgi:hypothetical protein